MTSTPAGDSRRDAGRGTRVVVGILTLAIGLGLFALWFQWRQTRRCLDFYGTETARLIQRATRVEVWERVPGTVATAGPASPSYERYDVSTARGLVHLRRGLVEDANLDWNHVAERSVSAMAWHFALAFFDTPEALTPAAVLLVERSPEGTPVDGVLSVEGRPGRVGLGRLAGGIERWWRSVRDDAVPVGHAP